MAVAPYGPVIQYAAMPSTAVGEGRGDGLDPCCVKFAPGRWSGGRCDDGIDGSTMIDNKIVLPESQLPRSWHNVVAEPPFDVPRPMHPVEDRGVEIEDYDWLWPRECLRIELQDGEYGADAWIEIPQVISDVLDLAVPN